MADLTAQLLIAVKLILSHDHLCVWQNKKFTLQIMNMTGFGVTINLIGISEVKYVICKVKFPYKITFHITLTQRS